MTRTVCKYPGSKLSHAIPSASGPFSCYFVYDPYVVHTDYKCDLALSHYIFEDFVEKVILSETSCDFI